MCEQYFARAYSNYCARGIYTYVINIKKSIRDHNYFGMSVSELSAGGGGGGGCRNIGQNEFPL